MPKPSNEHRCRVHGCHEEAYWLPVLTMVPPGAPEGTPPDIAELELPVCSTHKKSVTVRDVLDDEAWDSMTRYFESQGRMLPDRATISLDFMHIQMGFPC